MGGDDDNNLTLACYICNRSNPTTSHPRTTLAFDINGINGIKVIDPRVTCTVHQPILANCPQSGVLR